MKRNEEQYIPKVGDRVKLIELHTKDAHHNYEYTRELFNGATLIIDAISQWDNHLFPFFSAEAHLKKSGERYYFYAAKFEPASKRKEMKIKTIDNPILIHLEIGKLSISLFRCWMGFGYADFKSMGKRLNFGFIKFWLDSGIGTNVSRNN